MIYKQSSINARGKLIGLDKPVVMGIVNVTPDSFFDGGRYDNAKTAIDRAVTLIDEGAAIVDVGGMSSRPGAEIIDPDVEIERVMPVIEGILERSSEAIISVDTIHSSTARQAMDLGAHIVNDISAGRFDDDIIRVAAEYGAPFVCMHMQGMPKTMQADPAYNDVAYDVLQFFVERIAALREAGVKDVIIDPGFGFGKSTEHNYQLLDKLGVFGFLEVPVLAGLSRKSLICKVLMVSPEDALNGTSALHMIALQNGAGILRVHDVKEALEVIELHSFLKKVQGVNVPS